ncbi:hypothetical protein PV327_009863 [Microctonus hyperodae]|uniref:Uncharacterized protein n=1 Tax=Microctonus hyperodae TaxID=165561 RepID=A0AA39F1U6_MICHY|nr:hypothetical protein PV327_009863 [Microctonus hyperodae]
MGSSGPPSDRSLSSGISFPQWMRGKVDNRFDFEQGALSPPSYDDTFFHIKYPKSVNSSSNITQPDGFRSINTVINKQEINNNATASGSNTQITKIKSVEHIDFSKHPLPCRPFIPLTDIKGSEKISSNLKTKSITKSQGTDDGFHGEPARCGKSIVHVANRIMSGALGKKIDQIHVDEQMEKSGEPKIGSSKSLPVSPITTPISTPDSSPKVQRRAQGNRFFTGAFIPDRDKYQGRWILSSLFNQSREVIGNKIEEEDESIGIVKPKILNRKKSISSQNLSYLGNEKFNEEKTNDTATNSVGFQAEPSELREMNFWSPTSM